MVPLLGPRRSGGYWPVERWPRPEPVAIVVPPTATAAPSVAPTLAPLTVHIVGAVERPGVYALPAGSRLDDLVRRAGGLAADADVERVNLADYLRDAQQVHIPRRGSTPPPAPTPLGGGPAAGSRAGPGVGLRGPGEREHRHPGGARDLPGIGPAYAERIIAYREAHGVPAPEELLEVSGIGPARYAQDPDLVTID